MLIKNDNYLTMEPGTILHAAPLDLPLSLRSGHFQSPRVDLGELIRMQISRKLEDKSIEPISPELAVGSPMASSFCSSFSQGSVGDSSSTTSTGPSTPRTPNTKCEVDDMVQVDLSYIPASHIPRTLKRKSEPLEDEDVKRVKLPSLHHLLDSPESTQPRHIASTNSKRRFHTLSSSPEPWSEYTTSRRPSAPIGEDPITQCLNILRRQKDKNKELLPQVQGLPELSLDITLDFTSKPCQEEQRWPSEPYDYCYRSRQQRSPKEMTKKERAKSRDSLPHCNIKYLQEETDFLRYYKQDLKYSWQEITQFFGAQFPMNEDFQRKVQGVQGVIYRENDHIPHIMTARNELVFLPNGHVASTSKKIRQQGNDKRKYGLVYLYPERAMSYEWVKAEDRRVAAELNRERAPQRAQAKHEAMKRGTWVEKLDDGRCACCPKEDRHRDSRKRTVPERPSLNAGFEWSPAPKL